VRILHGIARATLAFGLAACGPAAPPAHGPRANAAALPDSAERGRRLEAWEDAVVRELAVIDTRLAMRTRVMPTEADLAKATMDAVIAGDRGLGVLRGALDLFSFEARARKLEALHPVLNARPPPPADELEIEIVRRLVYAEEARVKRERGLPRSASELVRGVVASWTPPSTEADAKERDAWLARRLEDVRVSLGDGSLASAEVWELEDSLDPLERLCDPGGYPSATAGLARLRIALGALGRPASSPPSPGAIDRELADLVGLGPGLMNVEQRLRETEEALRGSVNVGPVALEKAASLVVGERPCEAVPSSRVRSFVPPPERTTVCGALVALAHAGEEEGRAAALIALHDDAVVASWAYAVQAAGKDPERVVVEHPLLLGRDARERLLRFAVARPLAAIAVGLAASLVVSKSEPPEARARKWLAFGDAPLDIVQRELGF
jgi:hypothetical protein